MEAQSFRLELRDFGEPGQVAGRAQDAAGPALRRNGRPRFSLDRDAQLDLDRLENVAFEVWQRRSRKSEVLQLEVHFSRREEAALELWRQVQQFALRRVPPATKRASDATVAAKKSDNCPPRFFYYLHWK